MKQKIIFITIIALALSSQLVIAGSIADTYATGDTLTAEKMNNIKTAINGNAGDISTNTANMDINANNVSSNTTRIDTLENAGTGGMVGTQITGFSQSVSINDTTSTSLLSITVPNSGLVDVVLNAHAYIEKGIASGRYEFTIRESSCSSSTVGYAMWRPDVQTNNFAATTIPITSFHSIASSTTYHLCARKFDSTAANATVYARALNAIYK